MFYALMMRLFPSLDNRSKANYFAFEQAKAPESVNSQTATAKATNTHTTQTLDSATSPASMSETPASEQRQIKLNMSQFRQVQRQYYDSLFGQNPPTTEYDELSFQVSEKLKTLFKQPDLIVNCLPILPKSLQKIIAVMDGADFNGEELVELIAEEPLIAAKVLELANSGFYRRGDKEITDLTQAFMTLGTQGLTEGVINGFVNNVAPQSPIYYKQYGQQLWQLSLDTGLYSRDVATRELGADYSGQAYLIGLISNIGDMVIFQLMLDAFQRVHPDNQPNSYAFKRMMLAYSGQLAVQIAQYWQLPTTIVEALKLLKLGPDSEMLKRQNKIRPLAALVCEVNTHQKLNYLRSRNLLNEQTYEYYSQALLLKTRDEESVEHRIQRELQSVS